MPPIRVDGPVVAGTRRNLVNGVRDGALPEAAADAVIAQASEFVQKVVDAYDADVRAGEVGRDGSGQAGDAAPTAGRCPTGLLYGRVQSGKTAGMIAATALALDNGFRVVVIVTANNVTLVKQTATRFKALAGPTVLSTAVEGDYEWEGRVDDLRQDLPVDGLVLVCAKDATHLPEVISLFQELDAGGYPALILDDEADTATPDTTIAARTTGRANAPQQPSTTYRRVIQNTMPGEEGESIREVLAHHVYVQVTATPFVLLLQRPDSPLRPNFIHLLLPGDGYRGGDAFFGAFDSTQDEPAPPIVLVANTESQALVSRRNAPGGLANSMEFFLLSSAMLHMVRGERFPEKGYKHLAHTSRLTTHHDHVADVITRYLRSLRQVLRNPRGQDALDTFDAAYAELKRSEGEARGLDGVSVPELADLVETVAANISQTEVIKVNANTGEPQYGPTFNFVVGGNILGRGVTINDLLVTYYLREAQTSQMDTVWQHGRMFGYRARLMPYTRVYLPQRLALIFKGIHEAEETLREVLQEVQPGDPIPISVVAGTRSNRTNAVEPFAIQVYRPGTQIFPRYVVSDPVAIGDSNSEILSIVERLGAPMTEPDRRNRFTEVSFDDIIAIAGLLPVRDTDDGRWKREAVVSVLEAIRSTYGDTAVLYVRSFAGDEARRLQTGVLSGEEVDLARTFERPVLALVYSGNANAPAFWYGSLFLPSGMETQVFNANP